MPITLSLETRDFLAREVSEYYMAFQAEIASTVLRVLETGKFPEDNNPFQPFIGDLEKLKRALDPSIPATQPVTIHDDSLSILKRVLLDRRRHVAARVEQQRAKTTHPGIIAILNSEVNPYDDLLSNDLLSSSTPQPRPTLADFLTLEQLDKIAPIQFKPRQFDEKFHILQTPTLFYDDIRSLRANAEARGIDCGVVYLDIDDFKKLNTTYGHEVVDRDVLPFFMKVLESSVSGRGYAYRFGGDEYILMLGNGTLREMLVTLECLQERLLAQQYGLVSEHTSVSVGLCMVNRNCWLTDRSIIERSNYAMNAAKKGGKRRIAYFSAGHYDDADLQLAHTTQS